MAGQVLAKLFPKIFRVLLTVLGDHIFIALGQSQLVTKGQLAQLAVRLAALNPPVVLK